MKAIVMQGNFATADGASTGAFPILFNCRSNHLAKEHHIRRYKKRNERQNNLTIQESTMKDFTSRSEWQVVFTVSGGLSEDDKKKDLKALLEAVMANCSGYSIQLKPGGNGHEG
ncbi:hypothetical protein NKZ99_004243 [Salmonella enterica]|nr:hypothetical protein [Salmonella enterica]